MGKPRIKALAPRSSPQEGIAWSVEIAAKPHRGQHPRLEPRALKSGWSEWRGVVEVATALGGPLTALSPFAVAPLVGPLDLDRGPLEAGDSKSSEPF
jgi:hypothetical protein